MADKDSAGTEARCQGKGFGGTVMLMVIVRRVRSKSTPYSAGDDAGIVYWELFCQSLLLSRIVWFDEPQAEERRGCKACSFPNLLVMLAQWSLKVVRDLKVDVMPAVRQHALLSLPSLKTSCSGLSVMFSVFLVVDRFVLACG